MCGLFGHVGQRPAEPLTIKILWIYSSLRGTDSTGMYRNGVISKRWYEWHKTSGNSFEIAFGSMFRKSTENHTIVGHCRAKSVGLVSEKNTHPFEYDVNGVRWIFAHNGTIKNIDELAKQYNIDRKSDETDSQTLGHILAEGNWDVLKEYKGTAAFSLYNETEDTLYLWKGHSKHDTHNSTEERPLSIYTGRNYIYWASDIVNLATAINTKKNMYEIEPNTLLVIRGGKIVDAIVYDRTDVSSYYVAQQSNYYNNRGDFFEDTKNAYSKPYTSVKKQKAVVKKMVQEPNPQNIAGKLVYCWKGLYYKNGHLLHGEYMINTKGAVVTQADYTEDCENFYFFKGYMLKGYAEYRLLIDQPEVDSLPELVKDIYKFSENWLHPDAILTTDRVNFQWYIKAGRFLSNCLVTPKFGYYVYDINRQGDVTEYKPVNSLTIIKSTTNNTSDSFETEERWKKYF